jgi:hypothetical protein
VKFTSNNQFKFLSDLIEQTVVESLNEELTKKFKSVLSRKDFLGGINKIMKELKNVREEIAAATGSRKESSL